MAGFHDITALRKSSSAWRLLCAEHAPLVLGFLGETFIAGSERDLPFSDVVARLDDYLWRLNSGSDELLFPRTARAYLDEWAMPEKGWIRKFYPSKASEPHVDATPTVATALRWVESLSDQSFISTESRLHTLFVLLREIAAGAETDPGARLDALYRQQREIAEQIALVEAGRFTPLTAAEQRDRYQLFATMARDLTSDMRQVEDNLRGLDRQTRLEFTAWDGSKGDLLDSVLASREAIGESEQGRTFQAFYDFLLSPKRQDEFTELLSRVAELEGVTVMQGHGNILHDWLDAGARVQDTVRGLSEQLRRFIDDRVWADNRRVLSLIRCVEQRALAASHQDMGGWEFEVNAPRPTVGVPMERRLYGKPPSTRITSDTPEYANLDLDTSVLAEQVYLDTGRLIDTVTAMLTGAPQVSLADVAAEHPLELGLAELIGYVALDVPAFKTDIDDDRRETISWISNEGIATGAVMPRVLFHDVREEDP
jgi:hypothetical protein